MWVVRGTCTTCGWITRMYPMSLHAAPSPLTLAGSDRDTFCGRFRPSWPEPGAAGAGTLSEAQGEYSGVAPPPQWVHSTQLGTSRRIQAGTPGMSSSRMRRFRPLTTMGEGAGRCRPHVSDRFGQGPPNGTRGGRRASVRACAGAAIVPQPLGRRLGASGGVHGQVTPRSRKPHLPRGAVAGAAGAQAAARRRQTPSGPHRAARRSCRRR